MKVDNITRQYEIPGFDIAPQALEEDEAEDLEGAPYSRDPGVMSAPSTGGWQQLLGLMQSWPTPTTIDPPTRQMMNTGRPGATASFAMVKSRIDSSGQQSSALAPKVTQMMKLLASRQEAIAKIRIRAAEGGQ
jgi:hypothetical protein